VTGSDRSSNTPPTSGSQTQSADASSKWWIALVAIVTAIAIALIGTTAGAVLVVITTLTLSSAGVDIQPLSEILISLVMATGLGFGGVAVGYLRYRGQSIRYVGLHWPSLRHIFLALGGYISSFILAMSAAVLITLTGTEAASNSAAEAGRANPEILLFLIPASFLLIAPGEELLFRGIVQSTLREILSAPLAIVLASCIFAAIHYFSLMGAPRARLVSIAVLVLPTLIFGSVYEITDNLTVPILTHGAYNATLFSILYLQFA
jgi:CAAX amino terminal protease family.